MKKYASATHFQISTNERRKASKPKELRISKRTPFTIVELQRTASSSKSSTAFIAMAQEYDEYKSAWPTVGDKPQLTIQDGFPIEYNCEKVLEEGTLPPEDLWFIFDYEVTLKHEPFGVFPADIRRDFEWSLLWNVAIEVGLNNCSLAGSGFQVVALGSQNDDMIDTEPAGKIHSHQMEPCYSYVVFSRSIRS